MMEARGVRRLDTKCLHLCYKYVSPCASSYHEKHPILQRLFDSHTELGSIATARTGAEGCLHPRLDAIMARLRLGGRELLFCRCFFRREHWGLGLCGSDRSLRHGLRCWRDCGHSRTCATGRHAEVADEQGVAVSAKPSGRLTAEILEERGKRGNGGEAGAFLAVRANEVRIVHTFGRRRGWLGSGGRIVGCWSLRRRLCDSREGRLLYHRSFSNWSFSNRLPGNQSRFHWS
mmetsp:Transcript_535/g.1170  ORF Transcript_535/g.1170 Transcript_535/m.1170 type:complete len:232 (-) Transcript_535:1419-2114(-)